LREIDGIQHAKQAEVADAAFFVECKPKQPDKREFRSMQSSETVQSRKQPLAKSNSQK